MQIGLWNGAGQSPAWWPAGAAYAADFVNNRYMRNGNPITAAEAWSFSRASAKWAPSADGSWKQFAPNVSAQTDLGLSIEPAGSNIVPNPGLAGAAVGVVGAGGSLPTGWVSIGVLTTEVLALTTLAGLPALRLRISGTPISTFYELNMMPSGTAMAPNTAYAASVLSQLHAGSQPTIEVRQGNSSDAFVAAVVVQPGPAVATARAEGVFISQGSTVLARMRLTCIVVVGQSYSIELTVAGPQLELGSKVTSPMIADRAADSILLGLPSGAQAVSCEFDNGNAGSLPGGSGSYAFTTNLLRPVVRRTWTTAV
jgi:hypothetical protein